MHDSAEYEWIRKFLSEHFDCRADQITSETRLAEDLGADSVDLVYFSMELEDACGITIADDDSWPVSVGDAVRLVNQKGGTVPVLSKSTVEQVEADFYDEASQLTAYVSANYVSLRTDFERAVESASAARQKAAGGHRQRDVIAECRNGDVAIETALADMSAFWRSVSDRILQQHAAEVVINRCPACRRLLRTPKARQCFWCGHDQTLQ